MRELFRFPDVSLRTYRVWQRNRDTYKKFFKSSLALNFGEPIFYLTAMGLGVGSYISDINGLPYVAFIAPGLIVSSAMFSACFECTWGSYTRMTTQKTYDAILATPLNLSEIITGDILWGTTKSLITGLLMILVLIIFDIMRSPWSLLLPILIIGVGFLFSSLSMMVTALSPGYDYFNYFFTLVITPLFFFSGIFFPLSRFPSWVETVAWFTPLFHGVNISRALVGGHVNVGLLVDGVWLAGFGLLLYVVSVNLVIRRFVK